MICVYYNQPPVDSSAIIFQNALGPLPLNYLPSRGNTLLHTMGCRIYTGLRDASRRIAGEIRTAALHVIDYACGRHKGCANNADDTVCCRLWAKFICLIRQLTI